MHYNNYRQSFNLIIPKAGSVKKEVSKFKHGAGISTFKKSGLILMICISGISLSYSQILTPTYSNVDYVGKNNAAQKMDIYIPPGLTSPAPVIIFIHGGGWSGGSKGPGNVPFFQQSYNSGFICADINYRLSNDSVWPAQIEDCKTAIRYLKTFATTYNIDICRFGVIGESAGGHLASMIGTSSGVRTLEGLHQGHINQTSSVRAVVDICGPTDFLKEDGYYPASCGTNGLIHEYMSYETSLLGIDFLHNHVALVRTANPITYITSDDARFFIIHGSDDCVVPIYQSVIFNNAFSAAGIPADTFITAAGQTHGNPYFKDIVRTGLYNDFFLKHLLKPCYATGIAETNFTDISIYPNPATSEINIRIAATINFNIEIINTYGKTVLKTEYLDRINISKLKSGIYFIRLISANEVYTQKIIKL